LDFLIIFKISIIKVKHLRIQIFIFVCF